MLRIKARDDEVEREYVPMKTVTTTRFLAQKPQHFTALNTKFELIRYVVPETFYDEGNNLKNPYAQLHNCLRDQLDYPYKTFTKDTLDGLNIQKLVVYVLYPKNEQPKDIYLPFLSEAHLEYRAITFNDLEFHVLLKLLQIAYFRGEQANYFIGQDNCYAYAKRAPRKSGDICVWLKLQGDIRNINEAVVHSFVVIGQASYFRKIKEPLSSRKYVYFLRNSRGNDVFYIHAKEEEVTRSIQTGSALYAISPAKNTRTVLPYLDLKNIRASKGKILQDFIEKFMAYLEENGIHCIQPQRTFQRVDNLLHPTPSFPLDNLKVGVYDNRFDHSLLAHSVYKPSIDQYLTFLQNQNLGVNFVHVTHIDKALNQPILILQDYEEEDFEEKGYFAQHTDPYKELYNKHIHIAKQSLNVNLNTQAASNATTYMSYNLPKQDDRSFINRLEMALTQLYLKDIVLNKRSVSEWLPDFPTRYVFLRKRRVNSHPYAILLYVENDTLCFLNMRSVGERAKAQKIMEDLGVDWYDLEEKMLQKHRKMHENAELDEIPQYDIVIGENLFAELEELDERILFDFAEIAQRKDALDIKFPIEELKILSRFDTIYPTSSLSADEIEDEPNNLSSVELTKSEQKSVSLYRQLEAYDAYLDELAEVHEELSLNELTKPLFMETIGPIFDPESPDKEKYSRRRLLEKYKPLGMFSYIKSQDLFLYEGIWQDDDHTYVVGANAGMKAKGQVKAHALRRFDIFQGAENFDMISLLQSMSVQFVRFRQYTVNPYPFHLINVYAESVLHFQTTL